MRVILWDELGVAPDVYTAPRKWCEECRRATLFDRDMDGYPYCVEHEEEEVCHD